MPRNIRLVVTLAALALLAASGCEADAPDAPFPTATAVALPSPASTPTASLSPVPTVAAPPTLAPAVTSGAEPAETEDETDDRCIGDEAGFDTTVLMANSAIQWTPDGSRILFDYGEVIDLVVDSGGYWLYSSVDSPDLYSVRANGSGLAKLLDVPSREPALGPGASATTFDLSPDGSLIVYAACALSEHLDERDDSGRRVYNYEIFFASIEGTDVTRLTRNVDLDVLPAWSPDGGRIAFISDADRGSGSGTRRTQLSVYALATGDTIEVSLTVPDRIVHSRLAWSPDGERIAFVAREGQYPWRFAVYVVGGDGSGLSRLSDAASGPTWSPDGDSIAMVVPGEEDELALHVFATDGSNRVKTEHSLPVGEYNFGARWTGNLSWSPDGSAVLFENAKDYNPNALGKPLIVNVTTHPSTAGRADGIRADGRRHATLNSDIRARLVGVEVGGLPFGGLPVGYDASVEPRGGIHFYSIPQFAAWSPDGSQIAVRGGGTWIPFQLQVLDRDGNIVVQFELFPWMGE